MTSLPLPPQAFLLRDAGGTGQLGDGHHQDEGRMTFSPDVNAGAKAPLGEAVLMSGARGCGGGGGGT